MTREIARALGRAGVAVTIVAVSSDFPPGPRGRRRPAADGHLGHEHDEALRADGVAVLRVPPHRYHWLLDGLVVRRAVEELLARERVDVVLSYHHDGAFLPRLLRSRGVRHGVIATWQSYDNFKRMALRPAWCRALLWRRFVAHPLRRAEVVFATSRFTGAELRATVGVQGERIRLMPLGVEERFFAVPRPPVARANRLLFVGRVIRSKGVFDALEALGRLAAGGAGDWTLRIVGLGRQDDARALARELGIADRVAVRDPVDDAGLVRELQDADIAVLPSHFEAFGLAFAEAQAAGLPVVGYRAGSVGEVVVDGATGWLSPVGDIDALAANIARAMADPARTRDVGLAAREHVRSHFTWQHTAEVICNGLGWATAKPSAL